MIRLVKSGSLRQWLILSAGGLSAVSLAQQNEDLASFSITPSEPGIAAGSGLQGDEFQFKAELATARCFELAPEAGFNPPLKRPAVDGMAVFTHEYEDLGTYRATMWAYRDRDCNDPDLQLERDKPGAVKLDLDVIVKRPPVVSETPPSNAQFLVARSDPGDAARWAEFVFTANVSQARSYLLDPDLSDGVDPKPVPITTGRGGIRQPHKYGGPGQYTALLRAVRGSGETVELTQVVTVRRPAPPAKPAAVKVEAMQWPVVAKAETAARGPEKDDLLLWLLLAAGAVVAIGSLNPGLAATEVLDFVPTKDRGRFNVESSKERSSLVATRVWWRDSPQFSLSDDAAVTNIQSKIHGQSQ